MINSSVEQELLQANNISVALAAGQMKVEDGVISVSTKVPQRACCPDCKAISTSIKNKYQRTCWGIGLLDLPLKVNLTTIHFTCTNDCCQRKTFAPSLGITQGKSPYLKSVRQNLNREAYLGHKGHRELAREATRQFRISISERSVRRVTDQPTPQLQLVVVTLGIDEVHFKGFGDGTDVGLWDLDRGIFLGSTEGMSRLDLSRLWKEITGRGIDLSQIEVVVRDLCTRWDKQIIKELGRRPTFVNDAFHLIKLVTKHIFDQEYKPLRNKLKVEGNVDEEQEMFKARWAYRTGQEKLSAKQKNRLMPLLNRYPRLDKGWILKERVRGLYKQKTRTSAREELVWVIKYARDEGFENVSKLLSKHRLTILAAWELGEIGRRKISHYPEERNRQIRRIEKRREAFRSSEAAVNHMWIGYEMMGIK